MDTSKQDLGYLEAPLLEEQELMRVTTLTHYF